MPFGFLERLRRKEAGGGAIVLVGVVDPVRVELDLVVVGVEDRRPFGLVIGIRNIVFAHPYHRNLRFATHLSLYPLVSEFYLEAVLIKIKNIFTK